MEEYGAKKSYYGEAAASYDAQRFRSRKGRWIDGREKRSITHALSGIPKDVSILDLPCGTGRITEHILNLGYRVSGADVSAEMITLAKERVGGHQLLQGFHRTDAEALDFPDNRFDCITCVRLMGHLPSEVKLRVLREFARVARRYLVVTFYTAGPLRSLKWYLQHGRSMRNSGHWHPVTRSSLKKLFDECGVRPLGRWRVAPVLSDGITFLLRRR